MTDMELVLRLSTDATAVVAALSPVLISSDRLGVEWSVPAQFMELSVEQIIQSVLHAGAPTPNEAEHASYIGSASPHPSSAVDSHCGVDALLESDFPHTSLEGQTLHDYHALVTLGSVCTIIKYWVYMKLLWRHRGVNDNIVIAVMARCENMHEPHPLTNRKNSRQWTLVRNGLRIMEILLNNRDLLFQLLVTRRLSFNNLICLKQDWLQPPVLQKLVAAVQRDEQLVLPAGSAARKQNALSVAAMTALCEAGAAINASPAKSSSSPSTSSAPSLGTASKRVPTSRKARATTTRNRSDGKRKRRKRDAVVEDTARQPDRQDSADERREEASTIEMSNSAAPISVAADIGSADILLQLNHAHASVPLLEPQTEIESDVTALPSTAALLEYYFDLLQRYPDRVEVAASVEFASSGLSAMMEHRLQDRCTASMVVFDHSFLLQRSDRLHFLPAMRVAGGVSAPLNVVRGPAKVWVLFPRYDVDGQECDNEDAAMDVLDRHYGSRSAWTTTRDNTVLAPPLSMFLDAGVHVMLVIQREGEMVLLPSGKSPSRPGVHLLHSLSSSDGSSAFGMYQPIRHVVARLTERFRTSGVAEDNAAEGDFEEYDCGPFGDAFVEHAPLYTRPKRPTLEFLHSVSHTAASSEAANAQSHTSGADLNSSEQLIFLLNMALRDLIKRRVSPHPELYNELTELHRSAHTGHQRAGLLVALTQLMALYTTTLSARPHEGCSPHFGCGSDPCIVSDVERQNDASIFRHSRRCSGPVLYLRFDDSVSATLSHYEAQVVDEHTSACLTTVDSVVRSTESHWANIGSPNNSDGGSQFSSRASRVQELLRSVLYNDLIDGSVMRWWRVPLPSDVRKQPLNGTRSLPAQSHLQTQLYQLGCWDLAIPRDSSCAEHKQDTTSSGPTADCATQDAVQAVYKALHEMDADDQHAHAALHRDACSQSWQQRDMEAIVRSIGSHSLRPGDRLLVVTEHNGTAALHASCALGLPAVALDPDAERGELAKDIQRRWKSSRTASYTLHPEVSFLNEDLMDQLPLLFSASHLLIDQASLSPSAVRLMEEVLCHMVDSKLRWVYLVRRRSSTDGCQQNSVDHDDTRLWSTMSPVYAIHSESIQVQVYNVSETHQRQSLVQVFQRPSGDLGLRAAQRLQAHQDVLAVVSEFITNRAFEQLSTKSGSASGTSLLQWKGRWMRVENIAQFAQGHEDKSRVNLEYTTDHDGQLQYSTVVDIEQGSELFVCCLHGDGGGEPVHHARDVSTLHCLDASLARYLH